MSTRKILVIEYDVTGLTTQQADCLMLQAVVQAEAEDPYEDDENSGHPDVYVITNKIVERASNATAANKLANTTVVVIPHEKIALELCAELVKLGKTFRCEKTAAGWEFEVRS